MKGFGDRFWLISADFVSINSPRLCESEEPFHIIMAEYRLRATWGKTVRANRQAVKTRRNQVQCQPQSKARGLAAEFVKDKENNEKIHAIAGLLKRVGNAYGAEGLALRQNLDITLRGLYAKALTKDGMDNFTFEIPLTQGEAVMLNNLWATFNGQLGNRRITLHITSLK